MLSRAHELFPVFELTCDAVPMNLGKNGVERMSRVSARMSDADIEGRKSSDTPIVNDLTHPMQNDFNSSTLFVDLISL